MNRSNPSPAPPQDGIDALLNLCRSGQLDAAESQARDLLGEFPDDPGLGEILAGILAGRGKFQEAIPAYARVIETKPDNTGALFALANIYLYVGRLDEAIAAYRKLLEITPDFDQAHCNLGTALMGLGRAAEAIDSFNAALQLNPGLAEAHTNLGIALRNSGRNEEAVYSFRKALELEPEIAETHNNLGAAMEELGRLEDAIASYRKAISIMPAYAEAHCNLANAQALGGHHLEAVESYRAAIARKPDFAEAYNRQGVSLKELGKLEEAEHSLRKAIEIDPEFAQAHDNLGTVLRKLGRLKDSAASCRTALHYDPRFAAAYYNLGAALQLDGQLDAAVDAYEKALEIKPDFPDAHSNIGHALQDLGRFADAIDHYDAAGNRVSKARALECCFALGRTEDYNQRLAALSGNDPNNIWVAGITSFAAHQWDSENPYEFCKRPLDFISVGSVKDDLDPFESFAGRLIKEIENVRTVWEPPENTTINGYHTAGNLFALPSPDIAALQEVIFRKIEEYRTHFAGRPDSFITHWPNPAALNGWHIRILKDGYQEAHIHPSGWLSGVLYLRMPANLENDEGAITFTLHGRDYPILNDDIPTIQHSPKEGDLVLFPSSLYHYTNPFHTDSERHVLAFDLCPGRRPDAAT